MSVSVDTVYQRVLAVLNKEQRGFLTPQKFNLYANQVLLEKVESYFYDLEYYLNLPGNSTQHADMVDILQTKIAKFEKSETTPTYVAPHFLLPTDCYRLSTILYGNIECAPISRKEYRYITQSPIAKPSDAFPVYIEDATGIKVYGTVAFTDAVPSANPIEIEYIKKPAEVEWAYTVVLGEEQYNASNSTDFELDPSEETDLVIMILKLAGLEVKDLSVYETASREEIGEIQIERN
jgi:hypothetical protein